MVYYFKDLDGFGLSARHELPSNKKLAEKAWKAGSIPASRSFYYEYL